MSLGDTFVDYLRSGRDRMAAGRMVGALREAGCHLEAGLLRATLALLQAPRLAADRSAR